MMRSTAAAAAVLGALAVALGAFGAHALRATLEAERLQIWHTAVQYQFWHALALLAAAHAPPSRWRTLSIVAFAFGTCTFCASLYALALGAPGGVGAVTPLGGLALIAGWLALAAAYWCAAR